MQHQHSILSNTINLPSSSKETTCSVTIVTLMRYKEHMQFEFRSASFITIRVYSLCLVLVSDGQAIF
ncbi:unnamed protein product [Periconia digitata]|uniref:Uncharacterized protein n=1 Tax=Periconia digitata TaxID=1303443 RepID=A0A9W4UFY0_9PLEO|nr:unnamed protein product [Periconia digitata]